MVQNTAANKFAWPPQCPPLTTARDRACVELIAVNVENRGYTVPTGQVTHIVNIAYLQGDGRYIDLADTMAVAPSDPGIQTGGCHALQTWLSSDTCFGRRAGRPVCPFSEANAERARVAVEHALSDMPFASAFRPGRDTCEAAEEGLTRCCPEPVDDWWSPIIVALLLLCCCYYTLVYATKALGGRYQNTGATNAASQRRDASGEYAGLVDASPIVVVAAQEYDPTRASHSAAALTERGARTTLVATV